MKTTPFFRTLLLALLLAAGELVLTNCVKQKNCKITKKTFCVEGMLFYISKEKAYIDVTDTTPHVIFVEGDTITMYNTCRWTIEPSDIPTKYQVDGIEVRVSLLNKGVVLDWVSAGDSSNEAVLAPYRVKCIESIK